MNEGLTIRKDLSLLSYLSKKLYKFIVHTKLRICDGYVQAIQDKNVLPSSKCAGVERAKQQTIFTNLEKESVGRAK